MTPADNTPTPSAPETDPIVEGSLIWPISIAMVVLLVVSGWSLYDEFYTRRPYKGYQDEWVAIARSAYQGMMADAEAADRAVRSTPAYLALEEAWKKASAQAGPQYDKYQKELNNGVLPRITALSGTLKEERSKVAALTYRVERAREHDDVNDERFQLAELDRVKTARHAIEFPGGEIVEWDFAEMLAEFSRLKEVQGQLQKLMGEAKSEESRTRGALQSYVNANIKGTKPGALQALLDGVENFEHGIKQTHITYEDGELIERCESCHLGISSPVPLSLASVKGRREFVSHPNSELWAIHDPAEMGCSPCHGGNGIATASVQQAHGRYKYWLWPLHYPENTEAGCAQCHQQDLWLEHADTLNYGRHLFRWRGCIGCHRHEQFIQGELEEKTLANQLTTVRDSVAATRVSIVDLKRRTDAAEDEDEVTAGYAMIERKEQDLYLLQKQQQALTQGLASLELEKKEIGPNLKEVAAKLKPEWLQPWLQHPRVFRPSTKMPQFRLDDDQAWHIAAFLWQNSEPVAFEENPGDGDAERGEWLITVRGCLGCHHVNTSEYESGIGNDFAAELSRMGEKANYAYLVSWLQNPRHHNAYTVMPSLRLSTEDSRDIASFLMTKVSESAAYPAREDALNILTNPDAAQNGQRLVKHLGCAGCHEIKGFENEDRVGTELTKQGSKPLERLDFGTLTHSYYKAGTYKHKWFFEDKLLNPAIWDTDKYKENYWDELKMPGFWPEVPTRPSFPEDRQQWAGEVREKVAALDPDADDYEAQRAALEQPLNVYRDIAALTTFLLGSVEANIPASLKYEPTGLKKDIQEGWWLIKKYNCDGCHQILPGETPPIWQLPIYGEDDFEGVPGSRARPPTLVGQGTRTVPEWLMGFLDDPSLSHGAPLHENGVRKGLAVRMPTFFFSERERGQLVRFFTALARISRDYQREDVKPLEGEDLDMARAVFTAGACADCHLLGGEANINPASIFAPSFQPVAERIKPGWTYQWVTQPQSVIPKTSMPAVLKPERGPDGAIQRWVIAETGISAQSRRRVGEAMLQRLAKYPGDHARLLVRYFAYWNETEAEYQKEKRKIQ